MFSRIKTRFSPSPTGLMHLGNTRTALFSALYAYGHEGIFLLRIEDTDRLRSKEEFVIQLEQDLQWLGLNWQEGPGCSDTEQSYFQSQRQAIYDGYYGELLEKKLAYPCFCSEQQLAITRKLQLSQGQPPRYPGTCRHLTQEEIQDKIAKGLVPALRIKIPAQQEIVFEDMVKGLQSFQSDDIGDFIIRREDGTAPFMYCNAIDDALMGITHVIRGEDHLTNTPRQIIILQALNLSVPHYGHISLIVGNDGSPLSKRHGSRSVHELREAGYLPLALLNYLARLGHSYEDTGLLTLSELAKHFDRKRLCKSPAKFDEAQLLFWQKATIMQMSQEALWSWMGLEVHNLVPALKQALFVETVRSNILFPSEVKLWAEKFFDIKLQYNPAHLSLLPPANSEFYPQFYEALEKWGADYHHICETLKQTLSLKGKALYQPLRVILTDALHGPELAKIVELMGSELIEQRLSAVKKMRATEVS